MSQEKRQSSRSDAFLIAEYRPFNKPIEYSTGIIDNFSSEGLSFDTQDEDLKTGDILDLRLKSPRSGLMVSAVGEITWRREGWYKCTFGVRFREIDEEAKAKVFAFISDEKDTPQDSLVLNEDPPPSEQINEYAASEQGEEKGQKEKAENGVLESILTDEDDKLQEDSLHDEAEEKTIPGAAAEEVSTIDNEEYNAQSVSDGTDEVRLTDKKEESSHVPQQTGKLEYSYIPRMRKRRARKSRPAIYIAAAVLVLAITVPAAIYILDIKTDNVIPSFFDMNIGEAERAQQSAPVREEPETKSLLIPQLASPIDLPPPLPAPIVPDMSDTVPVKTQIVDRKETVSEERAAKEPVPTASPASTLIRKKTQKTEKPVAAVKMPEKQYAVEDEKKVAIENIIKRKSSRLQTVTKKIETPGTIQPEAKKLSPAKKEPPVEKAVSVKKSPVEEVVTKPQTDLMKQETAAGSAVKVQKKTVSEAVPLKQEKKVSPPAVSDRPEKTVRKKIVTVTTPAMHKELLQAEESGKSLLPPEKNLIADPAQREKKEVLTSAPEEKQAVISTVKEPPLDTPVMEVEKSVTATEDNKSQALPESAPVPAQKDTETADQPVVKIDTPFVAEPAVKKETVSEKPQPVKKKTSPVIGLVIRSKKK
jgi:hypothetical protein